MTDFVEQGMVVYSHSTDRKYVVKRDRALADHEEVVALFPHNDNDYSYRCGEVDCDCVRGGPVKAATPLLPAQPALGRGRRDIAIRVMVEKVRNATGHSIVNCRQAVIQTKDVGAAINWLKARRSGLHAYRI